MKIFTNESHTKLVIIAETDEDYELLRNIKYGGLCDKSQIPGEVQVAKAVMLMTNITAIEETPLPQT